VPPQGHTPEYAYEVVPLDVDGVLYALNDRGEVAGQHIAGGTALRAVRWKNGCLEDLGTLGGSASSARGINTAGLIVGGSLTAGDESYHAFLYEGGTMQDLNTLIAQADDYELIHALGINDRGDIIALAHHQGSDRAVLLRRRK